MRPIGVITGLDFEARALRAAVRRAGVAGHVHVMAGGPGRAAATAAAQALIARDVRALLSMGLAGALDPALRPGDAVLADLVIGEDGQCFRCDPALAAALGDGAHKGRITEAIAPVTTPEAKRRLRRDTGACLVDMESAAVARAAAAARLPMLALRTVSDTAGQAIPDAALAGMRADGGVTVMPVLEALLRQPGDLLPLIRLGRQSRIARAVLGRLGERLLARLVLMDI